MGQNFCRYQDQVNIFYTWEGHECRGGTETDCYGLNCVPKKDMSSPTLLQKVTLSENRVSAGGISSDEVMQE